MNLRNFGVEPHDVENYFDSVADSLIDNNLIDDAKAVFKVAVDSSDYTLFPHISANFRTYKEYVDAWIELYNFTRRRTAYNYKAIPKNVTDDMSVVKIISLVRGISREDALAGLSARNDYMLAESVQGYLLEEYIARETRGYGLLYVSGILREIDFCSKDGKFLLQIKNKNNSEASPSVKTGEKVTLWYRVSPKKVNGKLTYHNYWKKLNDIVTLQSGKPIDMSEESFLEFISGVIEANPHILGD